MDAVRPSELEKWFYGNGHFSLPLVNGMISLLCIGLSAGLMAVHFHIRSRGLSALVGAVMAVFPVVTSLFSFMYTIHYYMVALVMMTAGAAADLRGNAPGGRKPRGCCCADARSGSIRPFCPSC